MCSHTVGVRRESALTFAVSEAALLTPCIQRKSLDNPWSTACGCRLTFVLRIYSALITQQFLHLHYCIPAKCFHLLSDSC